MYKSDPRQCCYYICIFANILYLIKLIHSIIIILRVFMFYKERVLANFEVEKTARFVPVESAAVHVTALCI